MRHQHLPSKVWPTDSAQVTRQQSERLWLLRMQTQHEKACGTKHCQGKLKQNTIHFPIAGTAEAGWVISLRKTVYLNKLGEHFRISPSILFLSVKTGLVLQLFSDLCFLSVRSMVVQVHPLTSNGGIDLPPANEIKASFTLSLLFLDAAHRERHKNGK